MREVVINVRCDACEEIIREEAEGASTVLFTVRGEKWEMDLCDECINGTFLQEARPVKGKGKRKANEFPCTKCDMSFKTQRGLSQHDTKMHG